jgi:hypothetical protein
LLPNEAEGLLKSISATANSAIQQYKISMDHDPQSEVSKMLRACYNGVTGTRSVLRRIMANGGPSASPNLAVAMQELLCGCFPGEEALWTLPDNALEDDPRATGPNFYGPTVIEYLKTYPAQDANVLARKIVEASDNSSLRNGGPRRFEQFLRQVKTFVTPNS